MGPESLILSHFSLAQATFEQRVVAARAAGFDGIGLWVGEYTRAIARGAVPTDLRGFADDHGVRVAELEVLDGWATTGAPDQAEKERALFAMADLFGARHLHVIGPFEGSVDDAAAAFAGVCDRAAEHGLLVAIEALPFTNIADFGTALAIAERAGRDNGGLCIDTWHHFRGANDMGLLRAVPAARIVSVQINDGPMVPEADDYFTDTISNRRVPGAGEFDLLAVLADLDRKGVRAPLSVEVLSTQLAALAPGEVARRLGDAARALRPL